MQMNTLFGKGKHKGHIPLGYFIELNAGYTQFGSQNVFLPGINFGMILNHNWSVGLAGSFVANTNYLYFPDIYDQYSNQMVKARLGGGFGSFLVEYTLLPRSVVHVSFPLMIGGGYLAYYDENLSYTSGYPYDHRDCQTIDEDFCFVVEPGIRAEFNIIKKLRFGIGVSYRYSPDLKLVNTNAGLINQFTGRLSLRFGKF